MKNLGPDAARDLLLLSFVAGSADAAGYMGLGRVFTSNMTGNVVLLGIALAQHQRETVLRTLYVLVMFSFGIILGAVLARTLVETAWRQLLIRTISLEIVLLATFALCWALFPELGIFHYVLLALLAVAMGLQSATLNRLTIAGVTNTAVTGTLTSLVTGIGHLLAPPADQISPSPRRLGLLALVLIVYGGGALLSGLLILRLRWAIGVVPVLCLLLVLVTHLKSIAKSR